MESASIAHGAHVARAPRPARGEPAARGSTPQLLGVLLFIISEAMLFGSFFTAYFFIRVVQNDALAAGAVRVPGHRRQR